jgi:hypothetical protein
VLKVVETEQKFIRAREKARRESESRRGRHNRHMRPACTRPAHATPRAVTEATASRVTWWSVIQVLVSRFAPRASAAGSEPRRLQFLVVVFVVQILYVKEGIDKKTSGGGGGRP